MSIFDGTMDLEIAAASGTEQVLKRELASLGYQPGPALNGRIQVRGDMSDLARMSVNLRTANRIYVKLAEYKAATFDELYEGAARINWQDILTPDARPDIKVKCVHSELSATGAVYSVVKRAIADRLSRACGISRMPESGAVYPIEVTVRDDEVKLALDTSGSGLNKRGYRDLTGSAPLRETLAAAILMMSVWKYDRPLTDPFCGSGTIVVEAAMMATTTAPNMHRIFGIEAYKNAPDVKAAAVDEAEQLIITDRKLRISGFDIDPSAVSMAMRHARRAGVDKYIHIQRMDMSDLSSSYAHGVIVTNPPYGARLMEGNQLRRLYVRLGQVYRSLDNWSMYLITAYPHALSCIGMDPDRTRRLYNGQIECTLYTYLGQPPYRNDTVK